MKVDCDREGYTTGNRRHMVLALLIILSLSILTTVATAQATTYYVSPTGIDNNSGTSTAPFRTIQKAASLVSAGDTVIVRDGTYADAYNTDYLVWINRGGTQANPVTFRSENKWGATLDGGNSHTCVGFGRYASYVSIENFEMVRCTEAVLSSDSPPAHDIFIYGNHMHNLLHMGVDFSGGSNWTIDSNIIHDIAGDPTTTDYNSYGIYVAYDPSNTTIINNVFYAIRDGWHIHLYTHGSPNPQSNTKIINNIFADESSSFIGHILIAAASPNLLIENNIFYNPTTAAIRASFADQTGQNVIVRNNLTNSSAACWGEDCGELTFSNNRTSTEPLFVDPIKRNYHLQSSSPAIDAGSSMSTPSYDLEGNGRPQGSGYDIGAYEYETTLTDTTPPSTPAGLTAKAASSSQINLVWLASTDNVGVTGYRVYKDGALIGTTRSTSYASTGLSPSSSYTYAVAAYDAAGNVSPMSASASATTLAVADNTAPSTPASLTAAAVSSSQINLSWTASSDNVGVTGYKIYKNGSIIATATATTAYSDTGLSASTTYSYAVSAFDAAGNLSSMSTSASATTKAASGTTSSSEVIVKVNADTTPPSTPMGLKAAAASSSQINLSWTASTDNVAVAGYRIYRNGALIATTRSTYYSNTGLSASTSYTYTITAYDAANNASSVSAPASATTTSTKIRWKSWKTTSLRRK
jgi:chitodextrinase